MQGMKRERKRQRERTNSAGVGVSKSVRRECLYVRVRGTEKRRKTLSKKQRNEWAIFRLRD